VLDLIRLFTSEFEATALFTAEETDPDEVMAPAVHHPRGGPTPPRAGRRRPAPVLTVGKTRGVDRDRRTVEVEFTDAGVVASPERRSRPPALEQHHHAPGGSTVSTG